MNAGRGRVLARMRVPRLALEHHGPVAPTGNRILFRAPSEALRGIVRRFIVVESTAAHGDQHLPDTGLVAAFRFRGECRLHGADTDQKAGQSLGPRQAAGQSPDPRQAAGQSLDPLQIAPHSAVTGLWDRVRAHEHSADHAVVIAAFTPIGAAALFRQPLDALANTTVDLVDLAAENRRAVSPELSDRLADAVDHVERIRLVEELLLTLAGVQRVDPLVAAAVEMIERTREAVRIAALARRIGLSQRALERRFRRIVGASPRKFASLVRLQHAAGLRATGADFTTVAHAAGYSDQSHFVHDFKRFAGVAPGVFFGRRPPAAPLG